MALGETVPSRQVDDIQDTQTLEEAVYDRINYYRDEANRMEASLLRLPPAVRRLTRAQARSVGLYI